MAQSSQCYLPRFASASAGPKRPVSMKTRPTPSQHAQLLIASHEGRLSSLLRATWALVLHYYIRSEDICFGYQHIEGDARSSQNPVQRSSSASLSVVRLAVDENDSITAIVDKVRRHDGFDMQLNGTGRLEGISEGYLPFNTILMLRTYNQASDTLCSPPSPPVLATALPDEVGFETRHFLCASANATQCQVRLHVKVLAGEISIFLEWRNGDMSGDHMKSVANIFEQMLAKVLSSEDTAISQLNLFSENDWQRIRKWNSTTVTLHDRCIHEVIHEQALAGPEREAVCAWDGSLTYRELDHVASKLACHLRMQGVGPETRVALCFDKSVSLRSVVYFLYRSLTAQKWNVVAMLGVMKAGGAFVPLDATHPTSRLQRLVSAVQASILLCSQHRVLLLKSVAKTVIPLCAETLDGLSPPADNVDDASGVTSQNAAYVLFTSGSTGEPKVRF